MIWVYNNITTDLKGMSLKPSMASKFVLYQLKYVIQRIKYHWLSIYQSVENIMIKNSLPQHVLPPAHDEVVF